MAEIGGLSDLGTRARAVSGSSSELQSALTFRGSGDSTNMVLIKEDNSPVLLSSASSGLKIWRNLGDKDRFRTIRQPDGHLIEEGWLFDGNYYSCFFEVSDTEGQTVDFGPELEIDGVKRSGTVRLTRGIHHVKIASENWLSLKGLSRFTDFNENTRTFSALKKEQWGALGIDDEADVVEYGVHGDERHTFHDALYPYNQKLLIEGLSYDDSYQTVKVYRAKHRFAARLLVRQSEFNFEKNIDDLDYGKFAILTVKDDQGTDSPGAIVVKVDKSLSERSGDSAAWKPREVFEIVRQTSSTTLAEGLIFKAVFRTSNKRRCPSLDGYEIKVVE